MAIVASGAFQGIAAQERHIDSVEIKFKVSKWNLDRTIGDNDSVLRRIDQRLTTLFGDSVYTIRHISIIGGASPEGPLSFNKFLSEQRAATLFKEFGKYRHIDDVDKTYTFLGRDWQGTYRLAQLDPDLPYRDETLQLLETIVNEKLLAGDDPPRSLERMKQLRGGVPYRYLLRWIFPKVRASKVILEYDRILRPGLTVMRVDPGRGIEFVGPGIDPIRVNHDAIAFEIEEEYPSCRPFYMDIRTNMLYDVAALPNIGIEFWLGRRWSIEADWTYGWWKNDRTHYYWRAYGGEAAVRYWFGKRAKEKPLTGQHIGLMAGITTYDFEFGGPGRMGGIPGGTLWDRYMHLAGVEYGYSLPVAKRFNIDFSLALGYMGGIVEKYVPKDQCYVWRSTERLRWFGPVKAEVSLVWLIGCSNYNDMKKKGGKR